ncbi:type I polyketide synthase [Actinophytocola oryzae]|uniref:Pimaricinolide synthase loading module n=1 Tax=Actinophytocola oryzae TaxID=502181 RepID=A0A4R7VHT2_9PSEU|nr:type I polyketide synthase [Actinophytocola oryzae]TDV48649.1 pimaricinolide synthase loading module [Actinophytocola oryzae]
MALTADDYLVEPGAALLGHTLPNLLRAAVEAGPHDIAFADGLTAWTWQQWWHDTEALARGLQEHGVTPGEVVVAQLPNGWDFLVLHTAVAVAGGVLLPVHANNGPLELATLVRRSGARVAVVAPGRATAELAALSTVVDLRELVEDFARARPWSVRVRPDDPFLLLPSSATTSHRPKIAMHSHDGLLSNAAAVVAASGARRTDSVVSASPFTHLFGLLSIHTSLFTRTPQLLLSSWDADELISLARGASDDIVLFAVPTQVRDLLARLTGSEQSFPLREVRTGGSKVPATLVDDLRRRCGASVVVQWGMSELGAGLFTGADDPPGVATRGIGRPVPGARVRVVRDGADCVPGEVGELWVASPYAFRGYLGDPELTARAVPGDGWLRTGDLATVDTDGLVVFHGRVAELIDVGGQKFSATEVEEQLADLPGIGAAAVAGRPDTRLGEYPCLAVTEGSSVTLGAVTDHLVGKGVARFKIPVEIVVLPDIPHTATGKIARRRLADLVAGLPARRTGKTAVSLELVLARARAVLAEASGTPGDLRQHSAFRDHGLTSLGAVRLANELRDATGLPLTSTVVFDHPTPAALATHLAALAGNGNAAPAWSTRPNGSDGRRSASAGTATTDAGHRPEQGEDPLVITGMSCRLPGGVASPDEFWRLLVDERDAMGPVPADRGWPEDLSIDDRRFSLTGGYLDDIAGFDAAFFGVLPGEAVAMDPQQRLLLEVAWEAVEHAGADPRSLRDTDTGVFVGMFASDYAPRLAEAPAVYDGNLLIGNAASVASGRIAYVLGLRGPAVTVDTACSSSLVALHQAMTAIRAGDCDRAIVAGVTVMSTPATFVDLGQHGLLAPDGRCKPFADTADGVGWSEGVGALVVERLSAARRDGRRVLAVLRGSAINSDGASNGLSAPNGTAQRAVIQRALSNAGLTPDDVQAVEAHGTGTMLGDPIEAQALLDVYGDRHTEGLWVGSVKSNLGHTQAVAGVVGVIKMVLAIRHGLLPRTLHAAVPTAHVDWSPETVRVLDRATPWPAGVRRAGVSSFGISGTNAHVVVEEPPAEDVVAPEEPGGTAPWVFSAASANGLLATADHLRALAERVESERPAPADVARALVTVRSGHEFRAVTLPDQDGDHRPALAAFTAGQYSDDVVTGRPVEGGTAFVFAGQGQQWAGMASELARTSPPFAAALAECDRALRPHLGWSVTARLLGTLDEPPGGRVDVVQATLFATMVSLDALWASVGVRPDAVAGHSQGEVAAAYAAGALSLSDAARISAVRGRLLTELIGRGTMAAVPLPADEAAGFLEPFGGRVSIAAVNGPRSVVVSGDVDAVHAVVAGLSEHGVSARAIAVDVAGHCAHVDPLLARMRAELAGIEPRQATVAFVSTVTGEEIDTRSLTVDYWCRNLRETVDLHRATETMAARGYRRFVEISAHPVLVDPIEQTVPIESVVFGTLRRGDGGLRQFHRSVARAYTGGADVDWYAVLGARQGRPVDLPPYPFQHKRFWRGEPVGPVLTAGTPATRPRLSRDELVLAVRHQVAAVLGHDDPDAIEPDRRFAELGVGSLAAAELRNRLAALTGRRIAVTAVFDYPTAGSLADFLLGHAGEPATVLSSGPAPLRLVCLPSVTPFGGPAEFHALGALLAGERDAFVLPEPGFVDVEQLPADLDALLSAQVAAVLALGDPGQTVLCGHSSGGWIAHAVTERLVMEGHAPAGLVLLDTFWPDVTFRAEVLPWAVSEFARRPAPPGGERAADAYRAILSHWMPGDLDVPTLFVSAREALRGGEIRAEWPRPCERVEVDGDHFTMMTVHVAAVKTIVQVWLEKLVTSSDSPHCDLHLAGKLVNE